MRFEIPNPTMKTKNDLIDPLKAEKNLLKISPQRDGLQQFEITRARLW